MTPAGNRGQRMARAPQDGPYASHGCVHLSPAAEAILYSWAAIGTPVVVFPGDGTLVSAQVAQQSVDAKRRSSAAFAASDRLELLAGGCVVPMPMIHRAPALLTLMLVLASCATAPATAGTGIEGTVEVGPTCPVERINSPCPPRPMAATIVIRDLHGVEVARVTSSSDGHFKVDLPAGSYSLVGEAIGGSPLPRPLPTAAKVNPGRYTIVTVEYDSGIR